LRVRSYLRFALRLLRSSRSRFVVAGYFDVPCVSFVAFLRLLPASVVPLFVFVRSLFVLFVDFVSLFVLRTFCLRLIVDSFRFVAFVYWLLVSRGLFPLVYVYVLRFYSSITFGLVFAVYSLRWFKFRSCSFVFALLPLRLRCGSGYVVFVVRFTVRRCRFGSVCFAFVFTVFRVYVWCVLPF
jgi:hypothetical protein